MDERAVAIALGVTATVGLAAGVVVLVHPLVQFGPGAEPHHVLTGRPMTRTETLERFAASRGEYHHRATPGAEPGARRIPIVTTAHTPLVPGVTRTRSLSDPALFRAGFAAWRGLMQSAGRGDEDPRATFWLFLKETAWGKRCWGRNTGNRKAKCYANESEIRAGFVWDKNPRSTGVFLLVDRVRSFDSYRAFPTWEASLQDEKRLFEQPLYARHGVLDGYRRGGLDGLKAAIAAMHRGGYSPGVLAAKLVECEQYWAMAVARANAADAAFRRRRVAGVLEPAGAYVARVGEGAWAR